MFTSIILLRKVTRISDKNNSSNQVLEHELRRCAYACTGIHLKDEFRTDVKIL